jgi:hypothetical protein
MIDTELSRLKLACGEMLRDAGYGTKPRLSQTAIWAFWRGTQAARPDPSPYVTMMLFTGRLSELVTLEDK